MRQAAKTRLHGVIANSSVISAKAGIRYAAAVRLFRERLRLPDPRLRGDDGGWRCAVALVLLAGMAWPALADDYDYDDRRDTISSSAGNANAANIATQTIDPWHPNARNTQNHLDGQRARVGITRYQENKSVQPRGLSTTTITGQAGPGAQSSTSLQK